MSPLWPPSFPRSRASPAQGANPKRLILFTTCNGAWLNEWRPDGVGDEADLTPALLKSTTQVLEPYLDRMLMLDGLDNEAVGAPGSGHGHPSLASLWTGSRLRNEGGGDYSWPHGPSLDKIVGERIGKSTPFPSIPIAVFAAGNRVQTVTSMFGDNQPAPPQRNPKVLFDQIFEGVEPGPQGDEAAERLAIERNNVLDQVTKELTVLERRLSAADREQLQQHLTGVEEMQSRLSTYEPSAECTMPGEPGGGLSNNNSNNAPQVASDFISVTTHALACGLTNVVSFQLGNEGSAMGGQASWLGPHHEGFHNHDRSQSGVTQYIEVNEWYAEVFREYLEALESAALLDDAIVVWAHSMSSGWAHTNRNIPVIMVQGSNVDYFTPGRYLRWGTYEDLGSCTGSCQDDARAPHGGEPLHKLMVSVCQAMGLADIEAVGDPDFPQGELDPGRLR